MNTLFRVVLAILLTTSIVTGQQAPPSGMTIKDAIDNSLRNYPSVAVSQEQINVAAAGIELARTSYLPRVDSLIQVNRATRNNVFGLLTPQSVIPSISGPVLGSNNFGTVWGSAVGVLVTWEPFDMGQRLASVNAAIASKTRSEAALKRTEFEVVVGTADAYLTLVAAQEAVRAGQAAVDRVEVLLRSVRALVDSQLRPGADASRSEAELAAARTQLVQAQQAVEVSRAVLGRFVGVDPGQIAVAAPRLLELPPELTMPALNASTNPVAADQSAAVEQAKAQLDVLQKAYAPHFLAQGAAYARGTGARVDGTRMGGVNGLAPNTQNYALGFGVTFSPTELYSIRARQEIQSAAIQVETERYRLVTTDLTARWNQALAILQGSIKVAANVPAQVSAANAATQQAGARYQSGLGTITEVADAQRLLTQSEIDNVLARLNVWRGILGVAAAAGDIQPFLTAAGQ